MTTFGAAQASMDDQRAADDGDPCATEKLTELRAPATAAATEIALRVRRAAEGDVRAWERLVEQYAGLIWSITAEFKLAESDAADVAQTTWLRLLEHIDRIEHPDRVGSWLAATARNECLRSLAARKKIVRTREEEVLPGMVASGPAVDERTSSPTSARSSAMRYPACPGDGNGCWRCSWPIRQFPTPRYLRNLDFPSAALTPLAEDAWPGYAWYCRILKPVPATDRFLRYGTANLTECREVIGELVTGRCG